MKLIRFGPPGQETPGVQLDDGSRLDVSAGVKDYDEQFFEAGGLEHLRQWIAREGQRAPRLPRDVRLGPPIARPSKIICIGLNFRDHAAESGMELPN
jgi:2-keto-4-pentenoate hydratase/2-oxohepta-3-ene-1,7-dioic acid hydratase in catechol pathway